MKNKITQIALVVIILLLAVKACQLQMEHDQLVNEVGNLQLGEQKFKEKIFEDSSTIVTQDQMIVSQSDAIKMGMLKLDGEIKKVQHQVRQQQNIGIDSVVVPYVPNNFADTTGWMVRIKNGDSSRALLDTLISNSLIVPAQFSLQQKWYSINGKVKKDGVLIDSLRIQNESSVTIGWKKSGFLGLGRKPIVEIKNTNPYLSVSKMNNVSIKKKKGLFQNPIFWTGVGIIGGHFLLK